MIIKHYEILNRVGNNLEELISFVLITFIEEVVEERYDKQIFKKLTSRFLETLKKLFEDKMIFPVIISHCCRCTEFSDPLGGSDSIVPTLPSSSGKQLFHPTSLEDRRNDKHKNQEDEFLLRLSLLSHTNYSTHCYKISNCVQKFNFRKKIAKL